MLAIGRAPETRGRNASAARIVVRRSSLPAREEVSVATASIAGDAVASAGVQGGGASAAPSVVEHEAACLRRLGRHHQHQKHRA